MAYMGTPTVCGQCGERYTPRYRSGSVSSYECPFCKDSAEKEKEGVHFNALDEMSLEDRIRKIEEWIYHYKPPINPRDRKY